MVFCSFFRLKDCPEKVTPEFTFYGNLCTIVTE